MAGTLFAQQTVLSSQPTDGRHAVRLQDIDSLLGLTITRINFRDNYEPIVDITTTPTGVIRLTTHEEEFTGTEINLTGVRSTNDSLIIFNESEVNVTLINQAPDVPFFDSFDFPANFVLVPKRAITMRKLTGAWNYIA